MLKTILIAFGFSAAGAAAAVLYVGRTVISSPFQLAIPFGTAVKTTIDPANVWSWHYEFQNVGGALVTANVLVDMDGNGVMDTENSWLRVLITDFELISPQNALGIASISDGTGKRYSVGVGGFQTAPSGPVHHVSLTTRSFCPSVHPCRCQSRRSATSACLSK